LVNQFSYLFVDCRRRFVGKIPIRGNLAPQEDTAAVLPP
jgi:hypothetical protein